MAYNVFTQPTKAFEHSIEAPSVGIAFVIVLLTGIFWSAISLVLFNNVVNAAVLILMNIIQWIVLGILLFAFEIMLSGQRRHQIRADFGTALSVVGKLYIYALLTVVLFNVYIFTIGSLISVAAGILILIIGILAIIGSFIAVKVTLDASNGRALVAWILLVIVYFLIIMIAQMITGSLFSIVF